MADPEVRFPETYVSGVPVWARRRKRSSVPPLVSLIVILLALVGAVMIGVSLRMGSVEKGGAVVDGWIALAHKTTTAAVDGLSGKPAKVETPEAKVDTPEKPENKAEAPETKVEPSETTEPPIVGQSGRKGGRK